MTKRYLTIQAVRDIHRRYQAWEDRKAIAADHKVSPQIVSKIGNGERHSGITGQERRTGRRHRLKLPENLVELFSKYSINMLAVEFECSRYLVRSELARRGATVRRGSRKGQRKGGYLQIYESHP